MNFPRPTVQAAMFAVVFLVMSTPGASADERGARRPNLLVILADDLGYGDLACQGATDMRTPHLDRLFASGMTLTNFYANCPVCSPTRAALLSGRYQELVGVPGVIRTHAENNWGYLDPNCKLLPASLQDAGYFTSIIGKWHLGLETPNTPNERGFNAFRGYLGDMMDDYYTHLRHGINYMRCQHVLDRQEGHATELFTKFAVINLRMRADRDQPWFMYLAYNAPHTPIQPPEDWYQKVKARETGLTDKRAKLVALIEHMDDGIGQVLAALKETGAADNTIIVFTSDNGGQTDVGANNGPLRDGKQSVYEGGLKVPTCVVWPGRIHAGTTSELRAMSMDILPTLMDGAKIERPDGIDGQSFLPTLRGESQEPLRERMFFSRREGGLRYGGKTIEAVIEGPWKLLQNSPFEPMELYNLDEDPLETTNVFAKHPKIVNELSAALRKHLQAGGAVPWQAPAPQ